MTSWKDPAYHRAWREARKSEAVDTGLCVRCLAAPQTDTGLKCADCARQARADAAAWRERHREVLRDRQRAWREAARARREARS